MTNTPDKSEMKSCPFCGKPPVVQERKGILSASVGCDCAASPCVLSLDIALAKAIWNARASSRPPADHVPDMVERVARALCVESGDDPDDLDNSRICKTDGTPLPLWAAYEGAAIAALQAVPADLIQQQQADIERLSAALEDAVALIEKQLRQKASAAWDHEAKAFLAALGKDASGVRFRAPYRPLCAHP